MAPKARVQKPLYYKIGEACKALGIPPYVLRYWETEFPALTPNKSRSGQRVYSEKELEIIGRIKDLLYTEGYTIAGAKKKLEAELASGTLGDTARSEDEPAEPPPMIAKAPRPAPVPPPPEEPPALDTDAGERVQMLLSGIEVALQEAREILALLAPRSP